MATWGAGGGNRSCKKNIFLLCLLLLQCRSTPPSLQEEIDRLAPEQRILQAETFFRENEEKWALYAWSRTRLENLVTAESRETYRLLKNWLFARPVGKLKNMQVSAMYLDSADLWLGTWNGGLYRLSLGSGENFALELDTPALAPKVVYRIRKSGQAFWFAMHHGLRFYNYQTSRDGWLEIPGVTGAVSDFLENSGDLFVASLSGGVWRRTAAGIISPIPKAQTVTLAYQDDIGLLIGTADRGAFRWKNGVVEALENLQPVLGSLIHVNHIVNDGSSLWFASAGEGLFRWNYRTGEAYQFSAETLLLRSEQIGALLHEGDWVFIGDAKGGIAGYHLPDQKWYIWDSGRSLQFRSISALAYGNGELFYSTLAGGVYQIHWLKYLFALKEKQSR